MAVPPANGSMCDAWLTCAFRPTRANFAAWAQITTRRWIWSAFVVASLLSAIGSFIVAIIFVNYWNTLALSITAQEVQQGITTTTTLPTVSPVVAGLLFAVFAPLNVASTLFAYPFGHAVFMPASMGSLRQRFVRALRPWSLIVVGQALLSTVTISAIAITFGAIVTPYLANLTQGNGGSGFLAPFLLTEGLLLLISIPLSVYSISLQVQSGSVGTTFPRIGVFGINLLTGFVLGIGFQTLGYLVFAILRILRVIPF